jgi:hypothetical protein
MNLLCDTPLSPDSDTSSHQISSFVRRYRAEGNYYSIVGQGHWVTGPRSKVASTWINHVTHLCPPIHPPTKYQTKIFIRLGDAEQKGILVSKSKVALTQLFTTTHPPTKYQPKIIQSYRNYRVEGGGRRTWLEKHKASPNLRWQGYCKN